MPIKQRIHVAIGITTCNRLAGLQRLLNGIESLAFVKVPDVFVSLVVVENGVKRGAEGIMDEFAEKSRYAGCHYVHEPVPGIPFARNAVLTKAVEIGATILAFIDDDEFPERVWLDEGLHAMEGFGADVVAGPVLPVLPAKTAKWLMRGGGFDRDRWPTGTVVANVSGGNALIKLTSPAVAGTRFLEDFPLSGGEDTIFFRLLGSRGARMVWCDSAVVHEEVGEGRATLVATLRRAFRLGGNRPVIEAAVTGCPNSRAIWCAGACGRILLGMGQCIAGTIRGRAGILKGGRMIARGCGVFCAALGYQSQEYEDRHSSTREKELNH